MQLKRDLRQRGHTPFGTQALGDVHRRLPHQVAGIGGNARRIRARHRERLDEPLLPPGGAEVDLLAGQRKPHVVVQLKRLKHRGELVVAVGARIPHPEVEVDLGVRAGAIATGVAIALAVIRGREIAVH